MARDATPDDRSNRVGHPMVDVPAPVAAKAELVGAGWWVDELPSLVGELARDWGFAVGRSLTEGTEAAVAEVVLTDGTPAVLKLPIPRSEPDAANEIDVLRLAGGDGCARLIRADADLGRHRSAILMERLGPMMHDCDIAVDRRHELLVAAASRIWRPVAATDAVATRLPDGRAKAEALAVRIGEWWPELSRPCSADAVAHAIDCARRRADAHDPARAMLLHGDVHEWNALREPDGDRGSDRGGESGDESDGDRFKLVDPDGLLAEPEYDLGVLMREDPVELLDGDPFERAERLATMTGTDPVAVWEWGVVERVATGLLATRIGLQPVGSQMLAAADRIATLRP